MADRRSAQLKSSDRQIIAFVWEIGVAKSIGDARILSSSSEITVSVHAQCTEVARWCNG